MFKGFNEYMNQGKTFYPTVGYIEMFEKEGFFTIKLNGSSLNFNTISMNNTDYNINLMKIDLNEAIEIQKFIADNLDDLIYNEIALKIERLKKYLSPELIFKAWLLLKDSKFYLKTDIKKEDLVHVFAHIKNMDDYQEQFYEFFNIIAAGSSTPMADVFDLVIYMLKLKLKEKFGFSSDMMDVFWEYNEAYSRNEIYLMEFTLNDEEVKKEIKTMQDFVDLVFEYFIEDVVIGFELKEQ
jgi:hypothetical protein